MKLDEYRMRFSDYCSARALARLQCAEGRLRGPDLLRDNSDLFRIDDVEQLRAALQDTAAGRETERAAIARLAAFAERGYMQLAVDAVWSEILDWAQAGRIVVEGKRIPLSVVQEKLAAESDWGRRCELRARAADLLREAEDLYSELDGLRQESARRLGYPHFLAFLESPDRIDAAKLVQKTEALLTRTARRFEMDFPPLLRREAGVGREEATEADLLLAERLPGFDRWFANARLERVYEELFTGFGFLTYRQSNVSVNLNAEGREGWRVGCFAVRVPDDIRLRLRPSGNAIDCRRLLPEAARAQHFAWTSAELRPEFAFPGDRGVGDGWAALFETLANEPGWLVETFGFVENREYRRSLALTDLMRARRDAALLRYETEHYTGSLAGDAGTRYAELLGEALGVKVESSSRICASNRPLASAARLRGRAFAWQLREFLKTRYGHNWWRARKAGEMIIDLWNTGHRYTVEELAQIIGLGDLDFDGLADEMLKDC